MRIPCTSFRPFCIGLSVTVASVAFARPATDWRSVTEKINPPVLYIVGYSHLDTQWCWSYPQVIREFIPNTLHENFKLFQKYPDYVFNWTGSNRYRFIKEYYPEDYATLKKYVAQGRWFPAGSSIEEGDVNSPSEESLIRQVMYGNQFFRREFGIASSEYMLPDCFGFPASLPSILAHCGLKGFSTQKLTWGSAVGIPFKVGNWIGPDGRSIVAALDPDSYGEQIRDDLSNSTRWINRLADDKAKAGVAVDYTYYGVGDRGGAPDDRSVMYLEKSLKDKGPVHVVGGRADQMFNDLTEADKAILPSYKGDLELTQHSAGSISSEGAMKRWNRKNELLADSTERASVFADWVGALPYDRTRITDAWLRFLPGQFHDLMAGTALPVAYNYTWNDEIIAMNEFADVLKSAVGGVARTMDTRTKGVPLVVYNPLSIDRESVAEATVRIPGLGSDAIKVVGPSGGEVPSQIVAREGNQVHLLFLAKVPSIGFASYSVESSQPVEARSDLKVSNSALENHRYKVQLDNGGDVQSIYDKLAKREMLASPARLAFQFENPVNYPAWNMDWNDQRKAPRGYVGGPAKVKIVENGPVRVALEVTRSSEGSKYVQTIRLSAGDAGNRVEFATKIDWKSKECALKAEFPLTVSNPLATYNWELGTVQRGNDDPKKYEVASHKWSDLTDKDGSYGVSILDDCKYASDKPNDNTMRLTLIYTPGTRGGYQHQGTQDWGRNEMVYALAGHEGNWNPIDTQWQAWKLNQPLAVFQTRSHEGQMGRTVSLAHTNTPQVQIEALKKAEDSDEVIVRTNELAGKPADGVHISFGSPVVSAREVDGQERPVGPATIKNGDIVFNSAAYRPYAFAVRFGRPHTTVKAPRSRSIPLPYNTDVASSWTGKSDGDMDGSGNTIPGELLPATIVSDGVQFKFGPTTDGANNALACDGQTIKLPAGKNRRLYLVAASSDGDRNAQFTLGEDAIDLRIQSWDGFIGQWDNRLWKGVVPELTYGWDNPLDGLVPGFIKRTPVAWYADHIRSRDGVNQPYSFCYLFRYDLAVADDVSAITLPRDQRVKIMAASVAENPNDDTKPVTPLYDTLDHSINSSPNISPASGQFNDATKVTIDRPFYWSPNWKIRYTTDGSTPNSSSAEYTEPFYMEKSGVVKAAQFDEKGTSTPVAIADLQIEDTSAPKVQSISAIASSSQINIVFNEPVTLNSATNATNYQVKPSGDILIATLEPDNRTVVLQLTKALAAGSVSVTVSGVQDRSPSANTISRASHPVIVYGPSFELTTVQSLDGKGGGSISKWEGSLPARADRPWTINQWVYMTHNPKELTIIGGFGDGLDSNGAERFLIKFHNAIHFWGGGVDINSGIPFALNRWQMVTLVYDGKTLLIYIDGREVKSSAAKFNDAESTVQIGTAGPWDTPSNLFEGRVAKFSIWNVALPPEYIKSLALKSP